MDGSGPASNDRSSRLLRTKNGINNTSPSRSAQCGSTSQKEKYGEKAPPIKSPFLVRRCTKNCRATTDRPASLPSLQRRAAVSTEQAATPPIGGEIHTPSYLALCVLCSESDENSFLLGRILWTRSTESESVRNYFIDAMLTRQKCLKRNQPDFAGQQLLSIILAPPRRHKLT